MNKMSTKSILSPAKDFVKVRKANKTIRKRLNKILKKTNIQRNSKKKTK